MQCCTCKYNHVTIKYYVDILSLISQILTELQHIYQTEMYIDRFVQLKLKERFKKISPLIESPSCPSAVAKRSTKSDLLASAEGHAF